MSELIEYLQNDNLQLASVTGRDSKRLTIADGRGRASKLPPDKVLFFHTGVLQDVQQRIDGLCQEVDVVLLWEALLADDQRAAQEAPALAQIFFDASDALHSSAVFRVLWKDRLYFRRKGRTFTPRTATEVEELAQQRAVEAELAQQAEALRETLERKQIDEELAQRLERYLRGTADKRLEAVLSSLSKEPPRRAFEFLVQSKHLPRTADFEVLQANLRHEHPPSALAHAEQLAATGATAQDPSKAARCAFSIDDAETREIDDGLTVTTEGDLLRVDIDIADVAHFVETDDAIDREALRRATSVYLPTTTFQMLPAILGTDLASLNAGTPRHAVRTSVWLGSDGWVARYALSRVEVCVEKRLDYDTVDQQLAQDGEGPLHKLHKVTEQLRKQRNDAGAMVFKRDEWKIEVSADGEQIEIKRLPARSASRQMVAELMILANSLAARTAVEQRIPLIYRVQKPPTGKLPQLDPDDPSAFFHLRGLIPPASLSLHPGPHWALGLEAYTQITSPLRRYADLVLQRQISAHLAGEPPPYTATDLFAVLGAVDARCGAMKRVESAVCQRWALEYVARGSRRKLEARVMGPATNGYRLQLVESGAQGTLGSQRKYSVGETITVDVEGLQPQRGQLRLRLAN